MARIPRKSIAGKCTSAGYSLSHLWERHKEIARLLVCGTSQQEIARRLHLSESWVSIVCNSPIFRKYLDNLRDRTDSGLVDVRAAINEGSIKAANVLLGMLGNSAVNPSTQAKVAFDFLDRAGYGAVKTVRQENLSIHLTEERLDEIKRKRDDMLLRSRMTNVIEASYAQP